MLNGINTQGENIAVSEKLKKAFQWAFFREALNELLKKAFKILKKKFTGQRWHYDGI
jgi:hypothetical protein